MAEGERIELSQLPIEELADLLITRMHDRFGSLAQLSVADRAQNVGGQGPITQGGNYTIGNRDYLVIFTAAATVTLPDATRSKSRRLHFVGTAAGALNSATANVVPLAGGAAGTGILVAAPGKWSLLESDGVNWIIVAAN